MDARDFIAYCMERNRTATMEAIDGLSQEELSWQPQPSANHIGFLLFHIFRTEDRYVHRMLGGVPEVWEAEGWDQRWVLPSHGADVASVWPTGQTWTTEQMVAWKPPLLSAMSDYAERVRSSALKVVQSLDPATWEESLDPDRPQATRAFYLRIVTRHETQHNGQIDYIAGLLRAARGEA